MCARTQPLVTAVIPVYNHEKYVAASITSLIDQTYEHIELIVINDGSKDASDREILALKAACEKRFVRFTYLSRPNRGLSATLNQALVMASGEFFTVMASDDIAFPGKIAKLVDALQSSDHTYAAAFGDALFIDGENRPLCLDVAGKETSPTSQRGYSSYLAFRTAGLEGFDYRSEQFGSFASLLGENYLPAMSNLVRTDLIREVGGWTNGNVSEDWELWRKLSKDYRFVYVDEPVAYYRWHESNSVKTMNPALSLWSFSLLWNEKKYCLDHGLNSLWARAYVRLLRPVLVNREIPLPQKFRLLRVSDLCTACPYLAERLVRRLRGLL